MSEQPNDEQHEVDEKEANLFAINLLMPSEFIATSLEGGKPLDLCGDTRIKKLAREYGVTEQLMVMRLTQLGYLRA